MLNSSFKNQETNSSLEENTQPLLVSITTNWTDLFLKKEILMAIQEIGFHNPSEVQSRAIPKLLQGVNLICQAKSGVGKTAVFVIGILNMITPEANREYMGHQCLVIAHTRELAYQIHKEFLKFSKFMTTPQLRIGCYFGGLSIENDMNQLCDKKSTPHIIIGTPGRLLDLLYRGFINASNIKYCVIDECDVVLNKAGMIEEVLQLHKHFTRKTQYVLVSATISDHVIEIGKKVMGGEYSEIKIDDRVLDLKWLKQFYQIVSEKNKFSMLSNLLDTVPFSQTIVFVNSIERAKALSQMLDGILFNPINIHSELTQHQRLKNYDKFKANGSRILVATNLIGRGIDIERVNLVINYDFPPDKETYLHRIGRAGRFQTKGIVISFVSAERTFEFTNLKEFQKCMSSSIDRLPKNVELGSYLQS